jgi:site-specific DNA-adenine methylase
MWSYYGSKTNIVHLYPPPKFGKIIEPFAGAAKYATKYWDREVVLVDKYSVVTDIWKWLQKCSKQDILGLPRRFKPGSTLDEYEFDCPEARMLMGFLIAKGVGSPRNRVTGWVSHHRPNFTNHSLMKIADNLHKIKHWTIINGCYKDLENEEATWFVDPPYFSGGQWYVEGNKNIDYADLAQWCISRMGQVIVCEHSSATWLPFHPLIQTKGTKRSHVVEGIWSNIQTESMSYSPLKLF